jgi:hypothetical protein
MHTLEFLQTLSRFRVPSEWGDASKKLIDNRVCDVVRWLSFEPLRFVRGGERSIHDYHDSGRDLMDHGPKVAFGESIKISWRV